ncbi:transposase [Aerophototrophica crusticola]|uniref:Transposase n=1 Tax=Aerophototrophica crusticola TaxID=1709002 RepID=A0A858R4P0_9PROT|nr:transposase [Rhodospirillaceae bacterium B3]
MQKAWAEQPDRLAAARMPQGTAFATPPAIAAGMLRRAVTAGEPFAWAEADSICGTWELEDALRRTSRPWPSPWST